VAPFFWQNLRAAQFLKNKKIVHRKKTPIMETGEEFAF
jgi:hypothetical protein